MFFLLFVEDEPPWPEIGDGHANEFLGVPMGNERPGRIMDHAYASMHGPCSMVHVAIGVSHRTLVFVWLCFAVLRCSWSQRKAEAEAAGVLPTTRTPEDVAVGVVSA